MNVPTSGEQWTIQHGRQEAVVVEVGGGLRSYRVDDVEVVAGYAEDQLCRAGRGQLLMPWPNRIRDGRYAFDGVEYQLGLSEPALHNASHGLVRWSSWSAVERAADGSAVTVGLRLHPQPGWPGTLDLRVTYALGPQGLTVTTNVTNVGRDRVPFGYGAHPYVALGETSLADVELTVPADLEVLVDEQKIPTSTAPVSPETDFRQTRALGQVALDTAFTGLARDPQTGRWEVVVGGLATGEVAVWGDRSFEWVQVFTDKGRDSGVDGTRGVAVEPLSCPANAFASGEGLVVLEPAQSWSSAWGLRPSLLS